MLAVVVCLDGELYSATVADISARDALIYRKPTRSEQHDSQWLNGRDLISSANTRFITSDKS